MRQKPERWRSRVPPEDKAYAIHALERVDGFAPLRNGLRKLAERDSEWAGVPMPLEGQKLVIEPNYPHAQKLADIGMAVLSGARSDEPMPDGVKIRNRFWSRRENGTVYIYEMDGKIDWAIDRAAPHNFELSLMTLGCSDVWGIEQEHEAIQTLGSLVRHRQFKQYLLTGMFLERSKRSGLTYCFRRLRPTVVLNAKPNGGKTHILCTLCLHPIAYYEGSWGGAMCPTDDVLAHLMMMRGDEHLFWRRANQHPPDRREAGL